MKPLFAAIGFLLLAGTAQADTWEVLDKEGVSWVSTDNILTFYGFSSIQTDREEQTVELISPGLRLLFPYGEKPGIMRANGVRFRLFHSLLHDPETGNVLVRVPDLQKIVDSVVRPSFQSTGGEIHSLALTVAPQPGLPLVDHSSLDRAVRSAGWTLESMDDPESSPEFLLEILLSHSPAAEQSSIQTTWQWHLLGTYGSSRWANAAPLNLATVLHSGLVSTLHWDDLALIPSDPVKFDAERPFRIILDLQLADPEKDFPEFCQEISRRLAKYRQLTSP